MDNDINFHTKFYREYLKNMVKKKERNGTDNSKNSIDEENISSMNNESVTLDKDPLLVTTYQGIKGDHIFKSFTNRIRKILPNNEKLRIRFIGRKVDRSLQTKDKTEIKYDDGILY